MFKFHLLFCWMEGWNPTNVLHDFIGFFVDRVMSQNRFLLILEKLLTMKLYCSPPSNSDGIFSASFSASFSVRSPFVLRSSSVDPPFNLRSRSVQSPFALRFPIEERTENDRRMNEGQTKDKGKCVDNKIRYSRFAFYFEH